MLRANNYSIIFQPDAPPQESDSFTCGHCTRVVFVQPGHRADDLGGLCKQCMSLICPVCVQTGKCDPWEKKMEEMEARSRFLKSAGL